jgi:hypothetical protein
MSFGLTSVEPDGTISGIFESVRAICVTHRMLARQGMSSPQLDAVR